MTKLGREEEKALCECSSGIDLPVKGAEVKEYTITRFRSIKGSEYIGIDVARTLVVCDFLNPFAIS